LCTDLNCLLLEITIGNSQKGLCFRWKVWGMYGKNGKYGISCSLIFWRQDEATKHTNPNYLVQGFGGYYGNIWFSELSFFRRKLESYMTFTPPSSISSGAHGHPFTCSSWDTSSIFQLSSFGVSDNTLRFEGFILNLWVFDKIGLRNSKQ